MKNLMTKSFQNNIDLEKPLLEEETSNGDPDLESGRHTTEEDNLYQLFQEVETTTDNVDVISNLLLDPRRLYHDYRSDHILKLLREISDQIESHVVDFLHKANVIECRLQLIDESNAASRQTSHVFGQGSTVDRCKISITSQLRIKFKGIMNDFEELRGKILAHQRDELRWRFILVNGDLPSDDLLDGIISGCVAKEVVLFRMQNELYLEADEMSRVILKSLRRLRKIFLGMTVVVEKHGEELNDIEAIVACARSFVGGGTWELPEPYVMLCFFAVGAVVIIFLLCYVE